MIVGGQLWPESCSESYDMQNTHFINQTIETMQNRRIKAVVLTITALFICSIVWLTSCNRGNWNEQQRREAREMLREWREIVYLGNLTEEEFALFAGNVTDLLEYRYPPFVEFMEMPARGDSVEMVVVAAIVTDIKASPDRLRHIFSYKELVEANILPENMTTRDQKEFYRCFAEQVNMAYGSMQQFVWDALYSRLDDEIIVQIMRGCATPYWDIKMEEVNVK